MSSNNELSLHTTELDRFTEIIESPLNSDFNNSNDPQIIIQYLFEELMTTRKSGSKVVQLTKHLYSALVSDQRKIAELKKTNNSLALKLDNLSVNVEKSEKISLQYEEKIEFLTREVCEIEASLKESYKEKEKLKKELDAARKLNKESMENFNNKQTEKKSLMYFKEESSRKISELTSESSKKSEIIEDMGQTIKTLELKLASEKSTNENYRQTIHKSKNDIFDLNSKLSSLKTKAYSFQDKIKDLKQELLVEKTNNLALNKKFTDLTEKMQEKNEIVLERSIDDCDTLENTNENFIKVHNQRTEVLSDFFVTEEDEEKNEETNENPNENLVYFISSPYFNYPKASSLDLSYCDYIFVPGLYTEKSSSKDRELKSFEDYTVNSESLEIEMCGLSDLTKDPAKKYFLNICHSIKSKSPFREKVFKIPTAKLFCRLTSEKIDMSLWHEYISDYLNSILKINIL